MQQFRNQLPIYQYRPQIINALQDNIIIIAGETGCGKTTQVPQYIHEQFPRLNIAITQPRRVAAITLADRCSQEKGTKLGGLIGYNIRFDDCTSRETKITFMTDGMLIREQIIDSSLKKYDVIIIDEAHERTVQSDLLLALLKQLIQKRQDLKLILMSATMQIEKFTSYLNTDSVLMVEGRTHPIDIYNTSIRQADYVESMVNTILQIHFSDQPGDILAFLTGQDDIEDTIQILKERLKNDKSLIIKPLYSALPQEIQMEAFKRYDQRKVVLATNIAETSVTIDGIVYVIDCGYVKIRSFQSSKAIETLLLAPISKSQAEQRAGRAGRQQHGKCYRLYTNETYNKLARYMLPEILRTNLLTVILQMKAINIENVLKFNFIDQPDVENMLESMNQLTQIKALDSNWSITQHGRMMASLPLEPQFSNFLITAYRYGHYEEALNVVSILQVDNLFYFGPDRQGNQNGQKMLQRFKLQNSDHLTKAAILKKYQETQNKKSFCKENFLNQKSLKKAIDIKQQLKEYIDKLKLIEEDNLTFQEILKKPSYSPTDLAYRIKGSNQLAQIHPESVLFNQKPKFLIFNEVILTRKVYLRDVTEVDEIKE
ncbi:hypothetical protein pb186bvf_006257 [Paramecium bursaria]